MASEIAAIRQVDHLVLPVSKLDAARERLTKLGFTVAPDARHPFGTANACVFLPDGTYLEPLADHDVKAINAAVEASNTFAQRYLAYQFRRGETGFSAVAFKTDDAERDHRRFIETGWSGGPMLEFSRDLEDADGSKANATFRLAFAADPRAPDCLFFTCQRINFPQIDRKQLERHANGVVSLQGVVIGAPESAHFAGYLAAVTGLDRKAPEAMSKPRNHVIVHVGGVGFEFMDNREIINSFGVTSNEDRGAQARAIVFGVSSYQQTAAFLLSKGIAYTRFRKRIIVPPTCGQGAIFVFESKHDQT